MWVYWGHTDRRPGLASLGVITEPAWPTRDIGKDRANAAQPRSRSSSSWRMNSSNTPSCWRVWARGERQDPKTTENESRVWRAQRLPSRPWELGWHPRDSPPALSPEQLRVRSRLPTSVASSAPPGLPSSAFLDSCGKKRHVLIVCNTRRMLECVLISPNL